MRTDVPPSPADDLSADPLSTVAAPPGWRTPRPPATPTGADLRRLHTALLHAFDLDSLGQLLKFSLWVDLSTIVSPAKNVSSQMFDLLVWAEREGRLRDLCEAAAAERPENVELKAATAPFLSPRGSI